ncbi:MAG: ABC transporter permease [Lachnospiraceae bacterium]|nr:ABC transporter permease [Lachnospiraceae bacterium]
MKECGRKIVILIITLLIVSFLVFLAFTVIPGDPATSMLGTQATPEKVAALREEMGLNEPFMVRYVKWIASFLQGDMGTSYSYQMPVRDMIVDKIPITLTLTIMAFVFMLVLGIPLGIYAAQHVGGKIDSVICAINQFSLAIPPFFLGILMTYVFGLLLHLFTPGGFISYEVNMGAFLRYMVFPSLAIAIPKSAMAAKLLRSSVIEQAKLDYAKTAYSKGNTTKAVLWNHVLKNAMIPVITFLGMALADMIAGSIIIEQVFGIPGIGRILLTSISNRDYPVVQAIIVCIAFIVNIVNLFVDLLYRVIDPRIRME